MNNIYFDLNTGIPYVDQLLVFISTKLDSFITSYLWFFEFSLVERKEIQHDVCSNLE